MYYHKGDTTEINGKVCEFRRVTDDQTTTAWDLMRIRTDRTVELARGNYFGNGFYVAEYTWQNYQNPLLFEDLIISSTEYMDMGYFQAEKSQMYKPMTAFNSFVKGKLLEPHHSSKWLVDLAAGRGQDMFRVSDAKIDNALFIDSDRQALSELISRKHDFERGIERLNTRIYTSFVDLTTDHNTIINQLKRIAIPVGTIDVVMCNFAIHYLMSTPDTVRNLIHLIYALLKPGGQFFFTAFNGQQVFDKVKSGAWDVREDTVLKYSIRKKFTSDTLQPVGQAIDVLLPFSKGKYYTEYLVNYEYLLGEFEANKFTVVKSGSFGSYLPLFKKQGSKIHAKLSKDDVEFLKLYGFACVKKCVAGGKPPKKKQTETNIVQQIANNYDNIDEFVTLFNIEHPRVIEKVSDIPYTLPYLNGSSIVKCSTHIGQRKLFLTEVQFLTKHPTGVCVYAGSSPGNKAHYLSNLFPDVKFIFIDPNQFDIMVQPKNKSHRTVKHNDIIHIHHHFPTQSHTYGENKTIDAMTEDEQSKLVEFIKTSDHKIFVIEDYMSCLDAKVFKSLNPTFISDIRSNSSTNGYPLDVDIYWNMSMMYNWISIMQPVESMLKHRMPYGTDKDKSKINQDMFRSDFDMSRGYGIDFVSDYENDIAKMCKASLYIQAWPGISSTEMRMHILREDIGNVIQYDIKDIEDRFFYYNSINRSWVYHSNPNSSTHIGFCHCNDCALENKILTEYIDKMKSDRTVLDIVTHLGKVTHRRLKQQHVCNIWKPWKDDSSLQKAVEHANKIYQKARGDHGGTVYKKHRGDKGQK
jgi:SAM-dependent methyltransferase